MNNEKISYCKDNYSHLMDVNVKDIHTKVINDLIEWIHGNLESPININMIAVKSGYSRWHLQRIFKIATGQPIALYIRRLRLCKAAKELVENNENICDIAYKYQFDSQQSFWRAFRKEFLITPSEYRKIHAYVLSK